MPALDPCALSVDVDRLAAGGPRFCGTPGEERARGLLVREFVAAGLEGVAEQELRVLAYVPVEASCTTTDGRLELPCCGLQSTADAETIGEAVYLGDGNDDAVAAAERRGGTLAGRVAVIRTGIVTRVARALCERGVAALVNIADAADGLQQHFSATFHPAPLAPPWEGRVLPVPGVTLEAAAGRRLLARLAAGAVRLRVVHRARYVEHTTANVIGKIPGRERPGARVVLGAHYDTQRDSPGAADNAAGVAALLGFARAWRALNPRRTIVFAAFAAEELASWGAAHYVARLDPGDSVIGMVNFDGLGAPLPATRTIVRTPELAVIAAQSARAADWEPEVELDARDFPYADHAPFVDAGLPACWMWRYPPPHPRYHTAGDTPRWVSFSRLTEDALAGGSLAYRLAHLSADELAAAGVTPATGSGAR